MSKRNERPTASLNGMAHLDAVERPATLTEPVVRAKGGTAHGFFEVAEDVSELCRADLLQPGTPTPVFVRFSTVAGALRSADTAVPGLAPAPTSLGNPKHHDDHFAQPGALYREVLSETDRDHLVTNTANHLNDGVRPDILVRALTYRSTVDRQLGARVARAVL